MRAMSFFVLVLAVAFPALAAVVAPGTYTGKGASSPLTTKGDIFTYGTGDDRKAIGANGTIITADSAEAVGWKWAAAGAGTGNVVSINGDATAVVTLTSGTTGTDFAIVSDAAGDHKFNLPSASATARGLITTGTQTIAGAKTYTGVQSFAAGSAAAPSISATSGAHGFYFDSGHLNMSIGGVAQGYWDNGYYAAATASSTATYEYLRTVNTGAAQFVGGTTTASGAFRGYGSTHATKPGWVEIFSGNAVAATLNASQVMTLPAAPILSALSASAPVFTDGSKQLTNSGTVPFAQISLTGLVEDLHGEIATVADTTYTLITKNRVARQVTKIALDCLTSGSVTAKLQIDGVDITTCTGISVTTTESDTTCDTGATNNLPVDASLTLVTSSNSACLKLGWSIETTRD